MSSSRSSTGRPRPRRDASPSRSGVRDEIRDRRGPPGPAAGGVRRRARRHARHHLLGLPPHEHGDRVLGRRPRCHRLPERLRHRRRLHVGVLVPRLRRPHLPVRRRRVRRPRGRARRVPARPAVHGRADAQRRQVHRRRRALVPPQRAARARRRRVRHARRGLRLPDRADGRRRRADPGAHRHLVHARRDRRRRVHADLRDLRRHARHHVGADHQGGPADDLRRGHHAARAQRGRLQPVPAVLARRRGAPGGRGVPRARPPVRLVGRPRVVRARVPARHGRAAAHPDALLHRARRQGGARLGGVGRVPDRRLLPDGHGHRARRAGDPRARAARRRPARPATSRCRTSRSSWAAARAPRAARSSSRSSRPSRSPRSSRSWPGS